MSGKGFVDKNLFGLKDKLRTYQDEKSAQKSNSIESSDKEQVKCTNLNKENNIKLDQSKNNPVKHKDEVEEKKPYTNNLSKVNVNNLEEKRTDLPLSKLDKEYIKALATRRQEFLHKRSDLVKRIKINLNKLPVDIQKYESSLVESKATQRKLEAVLDRVNAVNEKDWDKHDYTLELAEAVRIIENSRLELFALQQNTDCLIEEDIPGLQKENMGSILPELNSLSFGQVFKMGIGFFLPLILGILLASGIITFGMFVAMGII